MSDQPFGPGGAPGAPPLTPEQEEFLRQQAVAQAQASPSPAADQAAAAAQMTERGPLLPAEQQIDQMMAALRAQSEQIDQMRGQLDTLHRAESEREAAAGGPLIVRYAESVRDHLITHAITHPDLGQVTAADGSYRVTGHFARAVEAADRLAAAAKAYVKREGGAGDVHNAADEVDRFISRGHSRLTGKHVDFGAAGQALEYVRDEAAKAAA